MAPSFIGAMTALYVAPALALPNVHNSAPRDTKSLREKRAGGTAAPRPDLNDRRFGQLRSWMTLTDERSAMPVLVRDVLPAADPFQVGNAAVVASSIEVGDFAVQGIFQLRQERSGDQPMQPLWGPLAPLREHNNRVAIFVGQSLNCPRRIEVTGTNISKIGDVVETFVFNQGAPVLHQGNLALRHPDRNSIRIAKEAR